MEGVQPAALLLSLENDCSFVTRGRGIERIEHCSVAQGSGACSYRQRRSQTYVRHRTDCIFVPCTKAQTMRWRSFIPSKATLVRHFKAAKRRLITQRKAIAGLPNARIVTATDELNQIVDDIQDAPGASKKPPLAIREPPPLASREPPPLVLHTVGKILRRSKIDK